MAWTCSARNNSGLIDNLVAAKLLTTPRVIQAFKAVDRAHFCPYAAEAYEDSPQSIGYGATISAPHMHAHAIENLEPFLKPGAKVLDVGSGSGYLVGVLHHLVSPNGFVLGIDHVQQLVDLSIENLRKSSGTDSGLNLNPASISVVTGDGRQGAPPKLLPEAGFDAIHVGAASPTRPTALINQLKRPGRMFIPVGNLNQQILQIDKDENGNVTEKKLFGVRYIPLTDVNKQWRA